MRIVTRWYRWVAGALGVLVAIPTIYVSATISSVVFHDLSTPRVHAAYEWRGMEIQPWMLEAGWWIAFALLAIAVVGRPTKWWIARLGGLLAVFILVASFTAPPPATVPPGDPVTGPLEVSSQAVSSQGTR